MFLQIVEQLHMGQRVKNLPAVWETWVGKSPGGEHGNSLRYPCLENPMDRGAWRDMVHRVAKSQTQLKQLSKHTPGMVKYKIHNKFKGKGRTSF